MRGTQRNNSDTWYFSHSPSLKGRGWGRLLHPFLFLSLLGLWTWKLLEPRPVPESLNSKLDDTWRFIAAKGLHVSAYAALALLAVTLPVPKHWRWFLAGLLVLHGAATEIGQTFVPHRGGSVRDVLIDCAGIALGVLIWRVFPASGKGTPAEEEDRGQRTEDS